MTGISFSITINNLDVRTAVNDLLWRGESLRPALLAIGEYLIGSHEDRFSAQQSPDGVVWAPLSEKYKKCKRKLRGLSRIIHADTVRGPAKLREQPDGRLLDKLVFGVGVGHDY